MQTIRNNTALNLVPPTNLPKTRPHASESKEQPSSTDVCDRCFGSGVEVVTGKGARACECSLQKQKARLIANIPPKFDWVRIGDLKPDASIHPRQNQIIPLVQSNPEGSYFLAGEPGKGKSLIMWAIYRHMVDNGQTRIVICTLSELLDEYRAVIQASAARQDPVLPRICANDLRQSEHRYSIFLDDIDKANPTEYAAEQVFNLVNAIYEYGHQLVVTTNKSVQRLIAHFDRGDSRGGPIVRRMMDGATVVEMF